MPRKQLGMRECVRACLRVRSGSAPTRLRERRTRTCTNISPRTPSRAFRLIHHSIASSLFLPINGSQRRKTVQEQVHKTAHEPNLGYITDRRFRVK
jgi:hypothetical protein